MTHQTPVSKKHILGHWAIGIIIVLTLACSFPYIYDRNMSPTDHVKQGLLAYRQGDKKKAEHHLTMAGETRDAQASYILGSLLLEKEPRESNAAQSAQYIQDSAKQGFVEAQYVLSLLYDQGIGVSENKQQALQWGLLAAARGHVPAIYASAVWLERGYNQKPEPVIALSFYEQAAAKGHTNAMRSLIAIYSTGENEIPQNKERAEFWLQQLHQIEQTQ